MSSHNTKDKTHPSPRNYVKNLSAEETNMNNIWQVHQICNKLGSYNPGEIAIYFLQFMQKYIVC